MTEEREKKERTDQQSELHEKLLWLPNWEVMYHQSIKGKRNLLSTVFPKLHKHLPIPLFVKTILLLLSKTRMKFTLPLIALVASVFAETTVFTTTVTTTRDPAAAATEAAAEQQQFLLTVILDAFKNAGRYQSVMEQEGMALPPELIQFVAELKVQDSDHGFPTSLFANRFPFTQFSTFVDKFPWVTTYYDPGMSTFKVPSEFLTQVVEEVITSTLDGEEQSIFATASEKPSTASSTATAATSTLASVTTSSSSSTLASLTSSSSFETSSSTLSSKIPPHASTAFLSSAAESSSSTQNGAMQNNANFIVGAGALAALALI